MDTDKCVLYISSDEETELRDQQVNLEWFCDQLFKGVDDSDDVVVVGEVLGSKKIEDECLSSGVDVRNTDEKTGQEEEGDDDDCVVLDGDPDKMVSVEENQDDGSEELVVVGEKGQVACRDYPHPRHLCVKYPFSSTLHKFHCEQCHCYVCDTVAPCNLWGTGMSIVDHCHATDKQEVWKTERKNFKLKRCSSLPALKVSENPSSSVLSKVATPISNQLHPLSRSITMPSNHFPSRSTPSVPTASLVPTVRSVLSPPAFRPGSAVRPIPPAPNFNTPNIMNPRSGSYKLPHIPVSQQLPGVYTKFGQRIRYQNATGLGPQPVPFKRTRAGMGYQAAFQSGHGHLHSSNSSYAASSNRDRPVGGESVNRVNNSHQWRNPGSNMNNGTVHKPLPQSHYVNRPHTGAVHRGGMSNQPATVSTQNVNQQVAYPSVMIPDVPVPWVDSTNSFSSQWDQPLQANSASNSTQWDQPQSAEVSSTPNTLTPWADNSNYCQSNQHLQTGALGVQVPQYLNPALNYLHNEHPDEGPLLGPGSDDHASTIPEPGDLHFEFEDWLVENQSAICNPTEPPFFSDQNILSPDDAHIDSALLDEWNLLTNVADM